MRVLITGGCGFLGTNVAEHACRKGWDVTLLDNMSREGTEFNWSWLQSKYKKNLTLYRMDIRDSYSIQQLVSDLTPDVIFHFAGQVAMTTSLKNPRLDYDVNIGGTLNILEAVRCYSPNSVVLYSSTNKVYGNLEGCSYRELELRYENLSFPRGLSEDQTIAFATPYGCSKGGADQYVLDYSHTFGLKTIVFRHSSVFGTRQYSTFDQGWIGWFVHLALLERQGKLSEPFTINGNGKQVRDVLFSSDLVSCYFTALENVDQISGQVFNIGGGIKNSISLLELFQFLRKELSIEMPFRELDFRSNDQKWFVAGIDKMNKLTGWAPKIAKQDGLLAMIDWCAGQNSRLKDQNL